MPKTTLTRQELYDLVWTDPTRTVAATYGVSDVWLKKVCAGAKVPTPDRGYWAKLAAGKAVAKVKLPLRDPGMSDTVSITKPTYNYRYDPEAELAEPIPDPPVFSEPLEEVRARVITRIAHHAYLLKRRADNEVEVVKRRLEAERLAREKREREAKARRDMLLGQARDWRTAADIRSFVAELAACRQEDADDGAGFETWRAWALAEADAIDPAKRELEIWTGEDDG